MSYSRQARYFYSTLRTYTSQTAKVPLTTETGKRIAAYRAVDDVLGSSLDRGVVGLGSGTTIEYAIHRIQHHHHLSSVIFIPTSFQTQQLILQHGLRIGSIDQHSRIDITIDGADEVDKELNAIKGGGACLFQERLVAQASDRFILIADERKKSNQLGTHYTRGIPIEIIPISLPSVMASLQQQWPHATVKLRMATPTDKAGPVVTDNGNFILDCQMGCLEDPITVYKEIKLRTGVVEVGLFCQMAETAYFGSLQEESVDIWRK
ncbi:ribose 5-phosphate isomerase A-domain-containing protein [Spinellus fusiger]|nr:ribose 5-phosphate isomerase A-domain-containing protein [Spinellus fusiger]